MLDQAMAPPAPWPPMAPTGSKLFVLGADIGQIRDFSAICAVQYETRIDPQHPGDRMMGEPPQVETHYRILGAQRLALGTGYGQVAARINQIATRLYDRDDKATITVLADATGVGRPVIEMLRAAVTLPQAIRVVAVTITGADRGDDSILFRNETRVGKSWLISSMQAALQGGRVHMPRDAQMAAMIDELKRYEIKVRPQGSLEMGVPESTGEHDDLATSLCLACCAQHRDLTYGPSFERLPSPVL